MTNSTKSTTEGGPFIGGPVTPIRGRALILAVALFASSTAGCVTSLVTATALLKPVEGSEVSGTVTFRQQFGCSPGLMVGWPVMRPAVCRTGVVEIEIVLEGLKEGPHGVHILERYDCPFGGRSANAHWNPLGTEHAGPGGRHLGHMGDLGNVAADENGRVEARLTMETISLNPYDPLSPVSRAVAVHDRFDDLDTQPDGASGPPIGCGVITLHATFVHRLDGEVIGVEGESDWRVMEP